MTSCFKLSKLENKILPLSSNFVIKSAETNQVLTNKITKLRERKLCFIFLGENYLDQFPILNWHVFQSLLHRINIGGHNKSYFYVHREVNIHGFHVKYKLQYNEKSFSESIFPSAAR